MYRIRLASGEESVFRSIEELARGIQSGVLSPDAQVFHQPSQQWLPISTHPQYKDARARAAILAATTDPEPTPLPALLEATGGPTVPIYQMFSRSAKELEERRRPAWMLPAAITFVGVLLVGGLALVFRPERVGTEEAVRITNLEPRQTPTPSHLAAISADSFRAARVAPVNLAGRMARGIDSTRRHFLEQTRSAGLSQLLSTDRLRSGAGLRSGLAAIATYDSILRGYRITQRQLDSVYRDSARVLERDGSWTRADLQEWRVRTPRIEVIIGGNRVDSVLATVGRVYSLLLSQQDSITFSGNTIRFAGHTAGVTYDSLRATLGRLTASHGAQGEHVPEPVTVLLAGLGDDALPPRNSR